MFAILLESSKKEEEEEDEEDEKKERERYLLSDHFPVPAVRGKKSKGTPPVTENISLAWSRTRY